MSRRWPFAPLATLLVIQPRRKRGRCGDRRGVIATISRCEMLELFLRLTGTQQSGWHPLKGNISWGLQFLSVPIEVSNIGTGPAFNVHCVLYGYDNAYSNQFISWNNGPIGPGKDETIRSRHPDQGELWLDRNDSVDGEHTLHYPPAGPNPNQAQACLTISLSVFLIIRPTISGYACL